MKTDGVKFTFGDNVQRYLYYICHYFDETESKVGNYWHYENGEIVVHTA